eukprot:scaffold25852_cov71-Phaeocystis_antarctica.AAC.2
MAWRPSPDPDPDPDPEPEPDPDPDLDLDLDPEPWPCPYRDSWACRWASCTGTLTLWRAESTARVRPAARDAKSAAPRLVSRGGGRRHPQHAHLLALWAGAGGRRRGGRWRRAGRRRGRWGDGGGPGAVGALQQRSCGDAQLSRRACGPRHTGAALPPSAFPPSALPPPLPPYHNHHLPLTAPSPPCQVSSDPAPPPDALYGIATGGLRYDVSNK